MLHNAGVKGLVTSVEPGTPTVLRWAGAAGWDTDHRQAWMMGGEESGCVVGGREGGREEGRVGGGRVTRQVGSLVQGEFVEARDSWSPLEFIRALQGDVFLLPGSSLQVGEAPPRVRSLSEWAQSLLVTNTPRTVGGAASSKMKSLFFPPNGRSKSPPPPILVMDGDNAASQEHCPHGLRGLAVTGSRSTWLLRAGLRDRRPCTKAIVCPRLQQPLEAATGKPGPPRWQLVRQE